MEERRLPGPGQGMRRQSDVVQIMLRALFARLDSLALATAMGAVLGLGLFLATAVLQLKGAPSGAPIGPNLSGLDTFLPGYSVSWSGAVIGGAYAAILGFVVGYCLAVLWNLSHYLFVGVAVLRGNWLD